MVDENTVSSLPPLLYLLLSFCPLPLPPFLPHLCPFPYLLCPTPSPIPHYICPPPPSPLTLLPLPPPHNISTPSHTLPCPFLLPHTLSIPLSLPFPAPFPYLTLCQPPPLPLPSPALLPLPHTMSTSSPSPPLLPSSHSLPPLSALVWAPAGRSTFVPQQTLDPADKNLEDFYKQPVKIMEYDFFFFPLSF